MQAPATAVRYLRIRHAWKDFECFTSIPSQPQALPHTSTWRLAPESNVLSQMTIQREPHYFLEWKSLSSQGLSNYSS